MESLGIQLAFNGRKAECKTPVPWKQTSAMWSRSLSSPHPSPALLGPAASTQTRAPPSEDMGTATTQQEGTATQGPKPGPHGTQQQQGWRILQLTSAMMCLRSRHHCAVSTVASITATSVQSYSLNKFWSVKTNAQIFGGPTAVLEKVFKCLCLCTRTEVLMCSFHYTILTCSSPCCSKDAFLFKSHWGKIPASLCSDSCHYTLEGRKRAMRTTKKVYCMMSSPF